MNSLIMRDQKMVKSFRRLFQQHASKRKWPILKHIDTASVSGRGDIVMCELLEEHEYSGFSFIKYHEKLGTRATIFIQPVFATRMGDVPDDTLECWHHAAMATIDRVLEFIAVVCAAQTGYLDITVTGHKVLASQLEALLEASVCVTTGVEVRINSELQTRTDAMLADDLENPIGRMEDGARSALGWSAGDKLDPDPYQEARSKLRLGRDDAWSGKFLDVAKLEEGEILDWYREMEGNFADGRINATVCDPTILRNAEAPLSKVVLSSLVDVAEQLNRVRKSSFIVNVADKPACLGEVTFGVEFAAAESSRLHIGVQVYPMVLMFNRSDELGSVTWHAAKCIAEQFVSDLFAICDSALQCADALTLDIFYPHELRSNEDETILIFEVLSTWIDALPRLIDPRVTVGNVVGFSYVESDRLDFLDSIGQDTSDELSRRFPRVATNDSKRTPFQSSKAIDWDFEPKVSVIENISEAVRLSIQEQRAKGSKLSSYKPGLLPSR